jgi:hypothetical protein
MTAVYMDKGAAESVKLKPEEVHDVEDEVEIFFSESSAQSRSLAGADRCSFI